MNIDELYKELLCILPYVTDKDKHFRIRLGNALRQYCDMIKVLEIDGKPLSKSTIDSVVHISNKIKAIVKSSMEGLPSRAFAQLHNLLYNKAGNPPIDIKSTILSYSAGESFYRIRLMDSVNEVPRKELFHIPLSKRGMVKTQRFSISGYPCLYLGETVYGCWEEMRRPQMYQCAVSRYENREALNFIDLTIPLKDELKNHSYLKLLPLIIACMIRVADDEATYKPEYIVPQLLMEWILKNRKYTDNGGNKKEIHGIAYISTHHNEEFEFPEESFINYAIPVFSVDLRCAYCKKLCQIFNLSLPTTNDIEKLKGAYGVEGGRQPRDPKKQRMQNYQNSDFGHLEERLNDTVRFPLESINWKH